MIGERGLQLAKDGMKALEGDSTNFYTDEELVTTAFIYAIMSGRETVILSRDEDTQEQFIKLKTRMVDHYCSMALADRYIDDPGSLTTHPMPMDHPLVKDVFRGEGGLLFERPEGAPDELVPVENPNANRWVPIYCWLAREQLTQSCFLAETQMRRLLKIKGTTGGLNTDRLDGKNCHIWLGGMLSGAIGNYCAIGEEVSASLPRVKLGLLDVNLTINNDEPWRGIKITGEDESEVTDTPDLDETP